ncbi:MAG: 16S rRNA (cytidine(1402)-2'-O)-methyltransferase [Patescibacteria group bacterium]|jgi:16S rRNA (cytidine1402-2'-O)-methyltransferase
MLYVVATPIGNLEDITLRALNTLFSADLILCEDTRKTLSLLRHYQKPGFEIPSLISYYEENEWQRIPEAIAKLKEGKNVALVSNAGTPTISDPGFKLVREAWRENIQVVSIPGPSSPIAALSVSGLPTDKFMFLGFLPGKPSGRVKLFSDLKVNLENISTTVIFFESPHRIVKALMDLKEVLGDIEIVIVRELTKVYEETKKQKIAEFIANYTQSSPRGEFVVLFNLKN